MQEAVLDEAIKALPDTDWWIKSDGCDIVAGLTESTRSEWTGDVDMGDGKLQKQYHDYVKRIELVKGINRQFSDTQRQLTIEDLSDIQQSLQSDLTFIPTGMCFVDCNITSIMIYLVPQPLKKLTRNILKSYLQAKLHVIRTCILFVGQ